jgi:sugar phosphate isomerase/epimerase
MQIGIFAKTFPRPTVEEIFDAVVKHRLNCVQFNMACAGLPPLPDQIETDLLTRICESAKSRGIALAAVSGTYNMIHPDPQMREEGLRRLHVLASARHSMGTEVITRCTGTRDPEDMWRSMPRSSF